MTKEFEKKVLRSCFVDTRKYRYTVEYLWNGYEIRRLPIDSLATSAAYHEWELVKKVIS